MLTLNQLFEISVPALTYSDLSLNKSTATATNSKKYICPCSVKTWTNFESNILDFFTKLNSDKKYQTWDNTFQLPDFLINENIVETAIQEYFKFNVINKMNSILKQEKKCIKCSTVTKNITMGSPDFACYLIDEDMRIAGTLIPIEIKKFVNINGSIVEKFNEEQNKVSTLSKKRSKTTQDFQIETDLQNKPTKISHLHNYKLICQLFFYMILNKSTFGIASTNNLNYFFKYCIDDRTLYISNPISCILNEQSKISIFKSMWYVLMEAEENSKNQSENEKLKNHYDSLLPADIDEESNLPSTSTVTTKRQKKSSTLDKDNSKTTKSMFKLSSIKEMIGEGASGVVRRYTKCDGQDIAIKIVDTAKNPTGFEQAKHEIYIYQILNHLQGICIPQINFVWEVYPFFIFGMTLLNKHETDVISMTKDQKKAVMYQLKNILSNIHNLKVSHNDIRFENIIIDKDYKVWLIDFGLAVVDPSREQKNNDIWEMNFLLNYILPSDQEIQEIGNGCVV